MADLKTRVADLTRFASTDDVALADWLKDGVAEIVNVLPPDIKQMCYTKVGFTSNAVGSEAETIGAEVGDVFAGSYVCREIHPSNKYKAAASGGMFLATATDPVYYIENSKINVLPASTSSFYNLLVLPAPAVTDSSIATFPDWLEYLVVLYASRKALQRLMGDKSTNLPSDISAPVMAQVSSTLPTYTTPDSFVLIPPPSGADIDFSEVGSIDSFVTPVFNAPTLSSMAAMSLPSSIVAPSISSANSVTINGTAPTYTQPVLSLTSSPTISDLFQYNLQFLLILLVFHLLLQHIFRLYHLLISQILTIG